MITITSISHIKDQHYDEIWAIVRFPKKLPEHVLHVPELAPSSDLWRMYDQAKKDGKWNEDVFKQAYVPRFLQEMNDPKAKARLKELLDKSMSGKHICLYCFCPNEALCHRSILAGILQWVISGLGLDCKILGVAGDYSAYGAQYSKIRSAAGIVTIPKIEGAPRILCFTGVRPNKLCGYERNAYKPVVKQLTELLKAYYNVGIRWFITGGAQGFDQLAFWGVHGLKSVCPDIQNIVYVPFPGQESIWPKTGTFSQSDYRQMIEHADGVVYVQSDKPVTKKDIVSALYRRNEAMVNHSDIVLALQNDINWKDADNGGTAHCMKYAVSQRRIIHRLSYTANSQLTLVKCTDAMDDCRPELLAYEPDELPFK